MADEPGGRTIAAPFTPGERPSLGEQGWPSSPRLWWMGDDLNSRSYSLCEVNAGYACSHRMRDWCNAGMEPAKVHCLSRGCSVGSVRDGFGNRAGCGMCFRARRRLSRRERRAGACARVSSGPLFPSLIRSHPSKARTIARVAENACDPQRTAEVTGKPMDGSDRLVVDDWCSAPMPTSGRLRQKESFTRPAWPHGGR